MAYHIRYGPAQKAGRGRQLLLTLLFFSLFLVVSNLLLREQLDALRQLLFPQQTWDAMAAFCQDLIAGYAD